jgi:hypothetical protein
VVPHDAAVLDGLPLDTRLQADPDRWRLAAGGWRHGERTPRAAGRQVPGVDRAPGW